MRRALGWIAAGVSLTLFGCDSEPKEATAPQPSQFRAAVQGTVTASYEGVGFFRVTEPGSLPGQVQPPPGGSLPNGFALPGTFVLFSADPGVDRGEGQGFALLRVGGTRPAVGTYALGSPPGFSGERFHGLYVRSTAGQREQYLAVSGEVRITTSTADRVAGSFNLRAVRVCTGTGAVLTCVVPSGQGASAVNEDVQISGTFSARPAPASAVPPFGTGRAP